MTSPMIDVEEIFAVCAQEFPDVEKRVFSEPDFLKNDGKYNSKNEWERLWETHHHRDAVVEHKETADKIVEISTHDIFFRSNIGKGSKGEQKRAIEPWKYAYSYKSTSSNKKYRCVGGPLDGKYSTIGADKNYVSYNCSANSRYGKKKYPTGMLIHTSLLGVK
jgi:hypothetical protein